VFNDYAEKVFQNNDLGEMDIVYADPPYNQHQYSSNYHLLTTAVLNDRYEVGEMVKGSRAGIRKDHNRSDFCKSSKDKEDKTLKISEKAFIDFINNVKTKFIVMSYNNEGIVKIDKLLNILSNNNSNKIEIKSKEYDRYKGSKDNKGKNQILEYLIIIEMNNNSQTQSDLDKIIETVL
jgi:adenine-specific DNA-methyltransferase